jgi:hypothetical protein
LTSVMIGWMLVIVMFWFVFYFKNNGKWTFNVLLFVSRSLNAFFAVHNIMNGIGSALLQNLFIINFFDITTPIVQCLLSLHYLFEYHDKFGVFFLVWYPTFKRYVYI